MTRHCSHSIEFKRQVAQEYVAGETLHALAKRHDGSRNLIRIWVAKFEAGAFDDDAQTADLIQEYEAKHREQDSCEVRRESCDAEENPDEGKRHAPHRPLSRQRRRLRPLLYRT